MVTARRTGFLDVGAFAGELLLLKDGDEPPPHLHVFSLSDFRKAVGKKWERLGGLVEVAVESIIRRNVDPERDIFTRLDAEVACLALPNTSRSETRTRVAAIARDISAHLFGDAVIDGRRPQILAANLPLEDALTADGDMDRVAIDYALAKAGAALGVGLAGVGVVGPAGTALAAPYRATLAALMTPEDVAIPTGGKKTGAPHAISGGRREARVSAPDWFIPEAQGLRGADAPRKTLTVSSTLHGADALRKTLTASSKLRGADAPRETHAASSSERGAEEIADWFDPATRHLRGADAKRQLLPLSPGRKRAAQVRGQSGQSRSSLTPESTLTLVWTPIWVTSRQAIQAFHARIIRMDGSNAPSLEGVRAYEDLSPIEALTLDRFTATQAARELKALYYARQKTGLTVPVHWMSLSPRWRDCIRLPFEGCPPDARRKFLKIEVFGLTPSIPPGILRRMFEPLEKIGCDVMARLPLSAVEMIPALSHLRAVGVDLAELTDDERVGDDELFVRLEAFRAAAKQARIACYVWGVRRRPLIAKVVRSGFSLVNGPGVMCDLSRPALPSGGGRPG
ncbi:MAG: hypothetical protein Q7R40_13530 [Phaeospirillum sp.]|nr:hypothetical protein [Phaeospirillum sp.]